MRLWILRPYHDDEGPWASGKACAFGFVVRAESESEARQLVAFWSGDERPEAWTEGMLTSCEPLSHAGEADVVLSDFGAG